MIRIRKLTDFELEIILEKVHPYIKAVSHLGYFRTSHINEESHKLLPEKLEEHSQFHAQKLFDKYIQKLDNLNKTPEQKFQVKAKFIKPVPIAEWNSDSNLAMAAAMIHTPFSSGTPGIVIDEVAEWEPPFEFPEAEEDATPSFTEGPPV